MVYLLRSNCQNETKEVLKFLQQDNRREYDRGYSSDGSWQKETNFIQKRQMKKKKSSDQNSLN